MENLRTTLALGCLVWLGSVACAPEVRPLGDEPLGGGESPLGEGGGTSVLPSGGGAAQECYAPQNQPMLSLEPGAVGCPCTDEPAECVRFETDERPIALHFACTDGRWASGEDGICWSGAECVVDGVEYPSGARRVPTPYSGCNTCTCMNGDLIDCTTNKCADSPCPEGTFAGRKCLRCGSGPGDCGSWEIGCFAECEDGTCGELCY